MVKLLRNALLASAACLSAACSTPGANTSESAQGNVRSVVASTQPDPKTGGTAASRDSSNSPSTRSVYFDFDSNLIHPAQRPAVEANGKFIARKTGLKVTVQGNTDERGSREYNLALGQRRAEAVKQSLVLLGAANDRLEAVSFGEEKPVAKGHDGSAWEKNRRADIVYSDR